ncbi:hypothetical protein ACFPVX_17330 [Cohnella faecalis]|uniref:Uncharacterized protein n=1 Tax=Cohnella faecalis TaxID=2315694 RepID=A0A398CGE0_9BACL|nr:hypothetical protein [Cohnella faecalis]RIE01525.1 hypothetical protein D3H35_24545 [Cohnella faecalis]
MAQFNARYLFKLKFKSPSSEALNTDFNTLISDVNEAIDAFNARFRGIKEIVLPSIEYSVISLVLIVYDEIREQITAKELTYFSRYLHNERDWVRFTKERTKLFVPIKINEITDAELFRHIHENSLNPLDYEEYFKNLELEEEYFDEELDRGNKGMEKGESFESDLISSVSDEQIIATLQSLLLNKDMGLAVNVFKKNAAVEKIKRILMPWIIS